MNRFGGGHEFTRFTWENVFKAGILQNELACLRILRFGRAKLWRLD